MDLSFLNSHFAVTLLHYIHLFRYNFKIHGHYLQFFSKKIFFLYIVLLFTTSFPKHSFAKFPPLQKESHTFEGNLATFHPKNVFFQKNKLHLQIDQKNNLYYGAEVTIKDQLFTGGRFETKMKPACVSGSITGFFLYRYNPWQEIDIEFIGKDFSKIQTSVVMNSGTEGTPNNIPNHLPKVFDLGFNACQREHTYTIEWDESEIRFYVDQRLIDKRIEKIPNLPMQLKANVWLNSDVHWVGTIQKSKLPASSILSSIEILDLSITRKIQQMSLDEKLNLLGGYLDGFSIPGNERLQIPSIKMTDGPHGIRFENGTFYPSAIAMAATFHPDSVYEMAENLGSEARYFNKNLLLAPCVNISRIPIGGRVFESFGEDPFLSSQITKSYVQGIQSQGVMTSIKHYAMNEQEYGRMSLESIVDPDVFYRLYVPPFEAGVQAGAATFMASYNKVNSEYASENNWLLNQVLKTNLGFNGFVMSDWGATHSTQKSFLNGLDIEMPNKLYFGSPLKQAFLNKEISEDLLNEKIRRILNELEKNSHQNKFKPYSKISSSKSAQKIAQESLVLLKNNNNILPLKNHQKIALIGPTLTQLRMGGGGSSYLPNAKGESFVDAFRKIVEEKKLNLQITTAEGTRMTGDYPPLNPNIIKHKNGNSIQQGFIGEYFTNNQLSGVPKLTRIDPYLHFDWYWTSPDYSTIPEDNFSVRWTGEIHAQENGQHEFIFVHDDGIRFYINDKKVIDTWESNSTQGGLSESSVLVELSVNKPQKIKIEYKENHSLATFLMGIREPKNGILNNPVHDALKIAKNADVVILGIGNSNRLESESFDRTQFEIQQNQIELLKQIEKINSNIIVLLSAGSPVDVSWANKVSGLALVWYPGNHGSKPIAETLLGIENFSGKLPITFPQNLSSVPAMKNYPETNGQIIYEEGMKVGYRGILNPSYEFGYGLSYSHFQFENVKIYKVNDSFFASGSISNTTSISGAEVIQVYVTQPNEDFKELKGFKKIFLNPYETKKFLIEIPKEDLMIYKKSNKVLQSGSFLFEIGTSLNTIFHTKKVKITKL